LGLGWSLQGLSSISRCPRTYAMDGEAAPITGTDADALCIDGKRLVPVSEPNAPADETHYRTAIDSFAKVVAYRSPGSVEPDYFKVWTNDGRIHSYGTTFDSKSGTRHTLVWALAKSEDRQGNSMTVKYHRRVLAFDLEVDGLRPAVI